MNIAFRVDASTKIGIGHVMRCITLAEKINKKRHLITFLCQGYEGNLNEYISSKGYNLIVLTKAEKFDWQQEINQLKKNSEIMSSLDWLIIDHYEIDHRYETELMNMGIKIMVIDDLANRKHDCHVLLDQNYYANMAERYDGLLNSDCKKLLGPKYALLREEFYKEKKKKRIRNGSVSRILISFGGPDPTHETEKVINAIKNTQLNQITLDIVVGSSNQNKLKIESICSKHENFNFYCQINNMAELINNADLGVGAGGSSTWERCFLGLPTIIAVIADNQKQTIEDLAKLGSIVYLGDVTSTSISINDYKESIEKLACNPEIVKEMSNISEKIMCDKTNGIHQVDKYIK